MTEILNRAKSFISANQKWAVVLVWGLLVLWLNSKYVGINKYNEEKKEHKQEILALTNRISSLEKENDLLEQKYNLDKQAHEIEIKTIQRRLETKIKILNKQTDEVDQNENDIIRLQEKVLYLQKK